MTIPPIETLSRVAALLLDEAPDRAYEQATNKAVWHLSKSLDVIETHGGFLVPSGTRAGLVHRVSVQHGCSCEAATGGKPCWHYACAVIIEQAREHFVEPRRTPTYQEALAAIEELYA
jgi:hypothetical protein